MSDTAEYWHDLKNKIPYTGKDYYHITNAECGHRHLFIAKAIDDVNCRGCLDLIKSGFIHNLPEGKTDFRSRSEKKRDAHEESRKQELEKLGKCSCGAQRVKRKNKSDGKEFLGCSSYPKCKITQSLKISKDASHESKE